MWRSILATFLLPSLVPSLAAAQTTPPPPPPELPAPLVQVNRPPKPLYHPYTYYDGLRRGRTEKIAVDVSASGFVTTPLSPVSGMVSLNLELQPEEGLSFGKFRYPTANKVTVQFQSQPVLFARESWIQVELHAAPNAALGLHVLKGKLTFQPVELHSGARPVRQVEVEIPINVVEHNAHVARAHWPIYQPMPTAEKVGLIVLIAPLAVVALPIYFICLVATKGNCGD